LFREVDERSVSGEERLLSLSQTRGLIPRDALTDKVPRADTLVGYKRCCVGDVVMNTMRAWNGMFGFATLEGIVSPDYTVFRQRRDLDGRYYAYLFASPPYVAQFRVRSRGMGPAFLRLNIDDFGDVVAPVPPLEVQRRIAGALDSRTAAIDASIAKKERIIELLQEKRQALITHAVTKGLDPSAPMKDAGNEWLGQVPTHWVVCRTKHAMSRIVDCPHETPEISPDFEYPAIRTSDVDRGRLFLEQAQRVSEATFRDRIRRLVPKEGDILYSREGGRFGHAALVPPTVSLCLGQRMMMFRTRQGSVPAYFMWVLNADCTFRQVTQDTLGYAAPRVNIPTVANAWVPCPPREEQTAIAAHIESGLRKLDALGARVELSVERLREYRQALITAAVTGKIDVSSEAA
jgi:type I restriction enzyme S subunit